MYHYEKVLKASDIVLFISTSAVIWSTVLISVIWVELLWAVYKFFQINNIDLKCSFVWCQKYHKSCWNGAIELHISVDLLCGTTATEFHNLVDLLSGTVATELHNSVDLLCGTTSAKLHNGTCLFPYPKPPLERKAWEWILITYIDSSSRTADILRPLIFLFTCQFYGLIPPIDSFFSWNVKYKTIKVFQVCCTSSTVSKSLFYILTYSGASSYGNKSIVPCVTLFP